MRKDQECRCSPSASTYQHMIHDMKALIFIILPHLASERRLEQRWAFARYVLDGHRGERQKEISLANNRRRRTSW